MFLLLMGVLSACPCSLPSPVPQKTIRHPRYNPLDSAYDIALIVLSGPSFVSPVKLAPASLKLHVGEGLFTAGWGDTQSQSGIDVTVLT
jgi:hypothetical protein